MLKCLKKIDKKATGLVAAGVLLGTAGVKLLGSKDAKKIVHQLYRSSSSSKRLCDEDCDKDSGECRRHLCRGTDHQ